MTPSIARAVLALAFVITQVACAPPEPTSIVATVARDAHASVDATDLATDTATASDSLSTATETLGEADTNLDDTAPDTGAGTGPDTGDTTSDSDTTQATDTTPDTDTDATTPAGLGTFDDPIVIDRFPYTDLRDTTDAPSAAYQFYACEITTDEGGGGFVYRVDVTVPGILTARLNDVPADGIDVDVLLLDGPTAADCLVRDNIAVSFAVTPGTYWLVTDTWVNAAGATLPGPYQLSVSLASDQIGTGSVGSLANPIPVTAFPFDDTRDTAHPATTEIDNYSCAPTTDEGGGEFVYRVAIPATGVLSVSVDDTSGDNIDVDVHLLGAADPGACLARANAAFDFPIDPGTYWVVVDTWVDASGHARAGPYHLHLDHVADAPPVPGVGTIATPIAIDALPFADARSTQAAPSVVLDHYACAPNTREGGPEVVYALTVDTAGTLSVSVDDVVGDGVDVDVHVLSGDTAATCIARDNRSLSVAVTPGAYLIVVDTSVDGSGKPLPGPYKLNVSLAQAPDLAQGCVLIYGDTRGGSAADAQSEHQVVADAMAARCATASLIHTGDFTESGTSANWAKYHAIEDGLHSASRKLYPARGNHDGGWAGLMGHLGAALADTFPDPHYARQLAPHLWFIALDSEGDAASQTAFLAAAMDDPARAHDRFIVGYHRGLYPSLGGHSGFQDGIDAWAPIFRRHKDQMLGVNGHNHGLSREVVDGVTYVTSAGGGAPLYGCSHMHTGTRYCANQYGYLVCDTSLRCEAHEVDPSTGHDTIKDAFSIP